MPSKLKLAFAVCALLASAPSLFSQTSYKLHDTWKLGGDGSWDYLAVDSNAHILYIARLDRVMLVDTRTGRLITEIKGLNHAHGIAFDTQGKSGYITDGGANTVLVFDRSTFTITATIPAGKNPDSITFEPTQHRLFVFNGLSHDATVIDAASNKVLATLPMPGKPEFSVTQDGEVFVNIEDSSQVLRIDAASLKTTSAWSLAPAQGPSGLAIDTGSHRLFSVCDNNKMAILDSHTGRRIAAPAIGAGADAVVFDAARKLVFSSNGESGTITVLQSLPVGRYVTTQTIPTRLGARTMALDQATGTLYTVSADLGVKPAASPSNPKRRPAILPGSFVVLVYTR